MELVEIRDLDGPNIFLLAPAIKIELAFNSEHDLHHAANLFGTSVPTPGSDVLDDFRGAALTWLKEAGAVSDAGQAVVQLLETPNHLAVAFAWSHRRFAMAIADAFARIVTGETDCPGPDHTQLNDIASTTEPDDRPAMIRDDERRIPVVGVTGTNGKTTTTRLIAHLVMASGKHAGWSSSSGVYIDGVEVLHGDYSGPSGARRVLLDERVDVAILETARGGILLRGIAYQSNDVSVFTNVSADHLDLQGIHTVEGLAAVKSIVVKVTRPDGTAVLNADDRLVIESTRSIPARKILFSRQPDNPVVSSHLASGGLAVVAAGGSVRLLQENQSAELIPLSEIPVTFGGKAPHMVENALAAVGAALGLGIDPQKIADGLRTFHNTTDQNLGRLNVFDVGGVLVVMDFAHNEVGLELLINFSRLLAGTGGQVSVVIGTAGDRTDQSLMEIGRVAAEQTDRVIIKDTKKYLRGRTHDELIGLFQAGVLSTGKPAAEISVDEVSGMQTLLKDAKPGDVVAIMCQEQMDEICSWLKANGSPVG